VTSTTPFRRDIERLRSVNNEVRSPERLHAHYEIEATLASRLRNSQSEERGSLYTKLYSELFACLPDHPQHRIDPAKRQQNTANQVAFLRSQLRAGDTYIEIGCGDAAVTQALAPFVQAAIGVDVTPVLIGQASAPANFRFVQTNGTDLALDTDCADLVYSNQLMEHLHPDDAERQLQEVCRVLKPGGAYICSTPNRITGPHDISCYFGHEPTGFHLREYDHASLAAMFRGAGFRSARAHITVKGRRTTLPVAAVSLVEQVLLRLPHALRTRLTQIGPVRNLAGVMLIGRK